MRPDSADTRAARQRGRVEIAEIDDRNFGTRPVDVLGRRVAPPRDADAGIPRPLFEHPRVADDQQACGVGQASIREHARTLLGADAGAVAEHQAQQRQAPGFGAGHVDLRSVKWLISRIIAKVISSMVIESTAIGPQSLLSRRSNMVTEIVLVRAVNSRMVAESSRIDPMKMKIQVAITPLRDQRRRDVEQRAQPRRAEDAARVLELGMHRLERCADLLIADRKLLRQVGEEDDRQGAVQNERRLRVGQEEADGEHDAGNGDRCGGQETEIAMSPHQLAQAQIAHDRHQDRTGGRRRDPQQKRVLEREPASG